MRRRRLRERDDDAPDDRLTPDHPAETAEHEQPERDAADAVDDEERERAGDADRGVERSHLRRSGARTRQES